MDLEDQVKDIQIRLPRFEGYDPQKSSANESAVSWAGSTEFYLTREHLDDFGGKGKGKKANFRDDENTQLTEADQKELKGALEALMFEFDLQDERPWRTDRLMDYFNYDLNERTFRDFIKRQIKLRFEKRSLTKLGAATPTGAGGGGGYLGSGGRRAGPYHGGGGGYQGGHFGQGHHHGGSYGPVSGPAGANAIAIGGGAASGSSMNMGGKGGYGAGAPYGAGAASMDQHDW